MQGLRVPSAYVDFRSAAPLGEVAARLSQQLFGGLEFIGQDTGIWDEVPAVKLSRRVMGLSVELGGEDGCYTLQVEASEFPWRQFSPEQASEISVDLSGFLRHLLAQVEGIHVGE